MQSQRSPLSGLVVAQFLGSFNDYAWKIVVTLLAQRGLEGAGAAEAAQKLAGTVGIAFLLPLALGALPAIPLADRFAKHKVIVATKALEFVLMLAAVAALVIDPTGGLPALVVVGAMGVQSALFSPAKYGILPQIVPHERLSRANGLIEFATFVAIVGGTATGPLLLSMSGATPWIAAAAHRSSTPRSQARAQAWRPALRCSRPRW